jgi:hypothetical protein
MLTRADRVCHRAQSTTMVHTGSIGRRSPLPSPSCNSQTRGTQNLEQLSFATAANRRGGGLLSNNMNGPRNTYCRDGNSDPQGNAKDLTSPVGYRPETLFLAKKTSIDDIFVDDVEYGKVHSSSVIRDQSTSSSGNNCKDDFSEDDLADKDFMEKFTVLNAQQGVTVGSNVEGCRMGVFGQQGMPVYGSSEEDTSDHV